MISNNYVRVKQQERDKIASDVEEFLASGGSIDDGVSKRIDASSISDETDWQKQKKARFLKSKIKVK